jgi:hypothetical protein
MTTLGAAVSLRIIRQFLTAVKAPRPAPLYYVDDHIKRLRALGESGLAGAFEHWPARLVS